MHETYHPSSFTYDEVIAERQVREVDGVFTLPEMQAPKLLGIVDAYADLRLRTLFEDAHMSEYLLRKQLLGQTADLESFYSQVNEAAENNVRRLAQCLSQKDGHQEELVLNLFPEAGSYGRAQVEAVSAWRLLGYEQQEPLQAELALLGEEDPQKLTEFVQTIGQHLHLLLFLEKETGVRDYQYNLRHLHEEDYSVLAFYRRCELAVRDVEHLLVEGLEVDQPLLKSRCRERYLTPLRQLLSIDTRSQPNELIKLEELLNPYRLSLSKILLELQKSGQMEADLQKAGQV